MVDSPSIGHNAFNAMLAVYHPLTCSSLCNGKWCGFDSWTSNAANCNCCFFVIFEPLAALSTLAPSLYDIISSSSSLIAIVQKSIVPPDNFIQLEARDWSAWTFTTIRKKQHIF